ncbi:hypothetical protein PROFUN_07061 [Planoprotostelium fungivorum]|uniref:Gamma-glutamylcyclotransferase AIG2-like domain-containing protein n=1 Tax=Planoprotostelium fungivorum TaxID=1890364 RepID=A0A2P6NN03_9EUKA|nr:hypothetical protein PROFUN_07061 [Planoprotostelium fungivorum]
MVNEAEAQSLLQIGSEHKLRSENLPFDTDVWYPSLSSVTFKTIFVPLTRPEARAIIAYQNLRYRGKQNQFYTDDVSVLESLEDRLDVAVKDAFPEGAFIRLCGRSPKDGEPFDRQKPWQSYQHALRDLIQHGEPLTANTKLRAIAQVNDVLKVDSGREVMSLLLTSERVFADLHDWCRWGEPEQIVLRQFDPRIKLEYEFRAFIFRGKMTAISQYDHYCVYPQLKEEKDKIERAIRGIWTIAHPLVGYSNYIMDFCYFSEISPFRICTGAACFSWKDDRNVLENGPFQFRLNERNHPHLDQLVETNWEDRWLTPVAHYRETYKEARDVSSPFSSLPVLLMGAFTCGLLMDVNVTSGLFMTLHLLFFYGTLKSGFHWNTKFLSYSKFVGKCTTVERLPLVIGTSGVPYLLGKVDTPDAHPVVGELWEVDDDTLEGLDEYEGVKKFYYTRNRITVRMNESLEIVEAQVYVKTSSSEEMKKGPFLSDYTMEYHKRQYSAIHHISVKQLMYMDEMAPNVDS